MTLDTLNNELKPLLQQIIPRIPWYMLTRMGSIPVKRAYIMVIRMGSISVERICMEIFWTHSTNKLSFHHQIIQEMHTSGYLLSEDDWGAQQFCGKILYNGGKSEEHSCGETLHLNNTKKAHQVTPHGNLFNTQAHLMTTSTWTPLIHSATM